MPHINAIKNLQLKVKVKDEGSINDGWVQVDECWNCGGEARYGADICEHREHCPNLALPAEEAQAINCEKVLLAKKTYEVANGDVNQSIDNEILYVNMLQRIRAS